MPPLAPAPTVDDLLRDAVPAVLRAVPGCDAAAVALVGDGRALTVAASDDATRAAIMRQYRHGRGPCLAATGTGRVTVDGDTLAVPIPAPDDVAGALTLHRRGGAWPAADVAAAAAFAGRLGTALRAAARRNRPNGTHPPPVGIDARSELSSARFGPTVSRPARPKTRAATG
jgi:hypothetical protein